MLKTMSASKYFSNPSSRVSKLNAIARLNTEKPQRNLTTTATTATKTRQRRPPVKIEYEENTSVAENVAEKEREVSHGKMKTDNNNEESKSTKIKKEVRRGNIKVETKIENDDNNVISPKKIKLEQQEQVVKWFPKNWELLLKNIKEMRKDRNAVVDSQGCERTADMNEKPEVIRFQTLVSLMLSSQTKDQVTFAAMTRLKDRGLTPGKTMNMSEEEIGKLIYPVGFWKRKAGYIKNASRICHEEYNGDIPNSVAGLTSLPGVGPKMAYICMNAAWGQVNGIGVDTHVHRIANRLKWTHKPTKTPEQTRLALEEWLPRDEWKDVNILLVGFGQQTCLPVGPKCGECLNKDICPASSKKTKIKKDKEQ